MRRLAAVLLLIVFWNRPALAGFKDHVQVPSDKTSPQRIPSDKTSPQRKCIAVDGSLVVPGLGVIGASTYAAGEFEIAAKIVSGVALKRAAAVMSVVIAVWEFGRRIGPAKAETAGSDSQTVEVLCYNAVKAHDPLAEDPSVMPPPFLGWELPTKPSIAPSLPMIGNRVEDLFRNRAQDPLMWELVLPTRPSIAPSLPVGERAIPEWIFRDASSLDQRHH
jgi:hypothetical protein